MTIFLCEPGYTGILSGIYDAGVSKIPQDELRQRLNSHIQEQLYVASLSEDVLRADKMYRYLKVLFLRGASAADQLQIPAVHEIFKLCRSVYNEKHQFIEFLRFSQMEGGFLAGKIQPKNDVLELIAPYFADRLGEENWLICERGRKKAVIHERGRKWLLAELSSDEMERLQREGTEENWAKLWKTFFTAIAIEERKNPNCQRNHLPLRFRDLMTEFQ